MKRVGDPLNLKFIFFHYSNGMQIEEKKEKEEKEEKDEKEKMKKINKNNI